MQRNCALFFLPVLAILPSRFPFVIKAIDQTPNQQSDNGTIALAAEPCMNVWHDVAASVRLWQGPKMNEQEKWPERQKQAVYTGIFDPVSLNQD